MPWQARPWCTPWRVSEGLARDHLQSRGWSTEVISELSGEEVCDHARDEWLEHQPSPESQESDTRRAVCLSGPRSPEDVGAKLREVGLALADAAGLAEFHCLFDELRDAPPCVAGGFTAIDRLRRLGESQPDGLPELLSPEMRSTWAAIAYEARNGDLVLVGPNGDAAWFVLARAELRPEWPDFASLLRTFVESVRGGWPMDSYGIPKRVR